MMDAVLGIDPAWTSTHPSGVALLVHDGGRWRCRGVSPSYRGFTQLAHGAALDWGAEPHTGVLEASELLDSAARLAAGSRIRAVTIDMPIALRPFNARRPADDLASRALSKFGCAVHSPTFDRPGELSRYVSEGFARRGFDVCTAENAPRLDHPLLEVYPHPAAMVLLGENYRVPYKVGKTKTYWPDATIEDRLDRILNVWRRLIEALSNSIDDIELPLPRLNSSLRFTHLKRFEDALDALICAWIGTQYLAGHCEPFGDDAAAIWVPRRADHEPAVSLRGEASR